MVTLLSSLDQILWTMNRITWKLPPIASNPIVDRFGPINRDHLLLATGSRQELTDEQRQCWDSHSFHPPLSAVRPRFAAHRLQMDNAILDYNYEPLRESLKW